MAQRNWLMHRNCYQFIWNCSFAAVSKAWYRFQSGHLFCSLLKYVRTTADLTIDSSFWSSFLCPWGFMLDCSGQFVQVTCLMARQLYLLSQEQQYLSIFIRSHFQSLYLWQKVGIFDHLSVIDWLAYRWFHRPAVWCVQLNLYHNRAVAQINLNYWILLNYYHRLMVAHLRARTSCQT